MQKTLTVFICSTFSDLEKERSGVLDAIRRLQLKHDSMEFFGARTDLPINTCIEEVRKSDLIVVIVGYRYGSLVPNLDISFSEAEYNEAYKLELPCLVYFRDENIPILPKHMERDPSKLKQLETFRDKLSKRHTVAKFEQQKDLSVQVIADLSRTLQALETVEKEEPKVKIKDKHIIFEEVEDIILKAINEGISHKLILSAIRQSTSLLLKSQGKRRPLVFMSYSHTDKNIVQKFTEGLRKASIDVWVDVDEIKVGEPIVSSIQRGLDSSDFMAFFISKSSINSTWANKELDTVITRMLNKNSGAAVLPILLDDVKLPALLRSTLYLDIRDRDIDAGINTLVQVINDQKSRNIQS